MINQEQQPLVVIQQPQQQIITTQPQIIQTQPVVVVQDGTQQTTQPNTVPTDAVQTKPEPTQALNTANMNFGAKMVLGANAQRIQPNPPKTYESVEYERIVNGYKDTEDLILHPSKMKEVGPSQALFACCCCGCLLALMFAFDIAGIVVAFQEYADNKYCATYNETNVRISAYTFLLVGGFTSIGVFMLAILCLISGKPPFIALIGNLFIIIWAGLSLNLYYDSFWWNNCSQTPIGVMLGIWGWYKLISACCSSVSGGARYRI